MYYRLADAHVRMLLDLTREHMTHEHTATQPAPVEHVEPTTAQSVTSRVSTRRAASTRTGASA